MGQSKPKAMSRRLLGLAAAFPRQRAGRNLSISQTRAAAACRCWQLSPALRNSRQSLPLNSDLNLTKPPLTGQRISKKTTISNGNITPHSSSARFCIYIKERSVAKNYYCSLCKSQALQGKAFKLQGRQTHTARRVFLGVFSCVQLSRSAPWGKPDQAHILPACCVGFEIGASLHMVNHQIFFFLNFTNNCRLLSATVISICSTGFQQDWKEREWRWLRTKKVFN